MIGINFQYKTLSLTYIITYYLMEEQIKQLNELMFYLFAPNEVGIVYFVKHLCLAVPECDNRQSCNRKKLCSKLCLQIISRIIFYKNK